MAKIKVGVLGATGLVGQRFIQLLQDHPWFELTELAASEKSAGKKYADAANWLISPDVPDYIKDIEIKKAEPNLDCDLVFSALPTNIGGKIEENFARNGYVVASNTRDHRMEEDVPLLVPEVNPEHLELIEVQKKKRKWDGFIVTNPNCSSIQLSIVLKALYDSFGIKQVLLTTMQALSGPGYPGVPSLDIIDNIIPYIKDEEQKIESEPLKILGNLGKEKINNAEIDISACCNRVNVSDGHLQCVSVKLGQTVNSEALIGCFDKFRSLPQELNLFSAPERPIIVRKEIDRPQPKFDKHLEKSMASVVGRIRECNILDFKFLVLGHNSVRGAAGASVLNAELMKAKNCLSVRK